MAALAYRPSADAAGSCSYLSDGMSPLVVHEHLIRAAAALVLVQASRSAITRVDSECGRTNQPQDRMPPLQAPISTGNGCVCVGGLGPYALLLRMRCCSSHNRSSDGPLIRTTRMRRIHHMRGGADDVTGLSTAALTASTHANLSGCSGHADRSRPSVDAAASCS